MAERGEIDMEQVLSDDQKKNVQEWTNKAFAKNTDALATQHILTQKAEGEEAENRALAALRKIQTELGELMQSDEYAAFNKAMKEDDPGELANAADVLNAKLGEFDRQLAEMPGNLSGDVLKKKEELEQSIEKVKKFFFEELQDSEATTK